MATPDPLLRRVTSLTVIAAFASAALVAVCSSFLADRLLTRADDRRLQEIAQAMLSDVERHVNNSTLQGWFTRRFGDFAPAGFMLTLFKEGEETLGMPILHPHHLGGCETQMLDDEPPWRVCSATNGDYTFAVSKLHDTITDHRSTLAVACIAALLVAGGVALLTNRRITALLRQLNGEMTKSQRFAADAAHEMRTPLATLSAELELLSESPTLQGGDAQAVHKTRSTLDGLKRLVERLLMLATEPNRDLVLREVVSLSEVLDAVAAELAPEQRARVHVHSIDELAVVRGDFELIRTLFGNAIDNALKYSTGGVTVTVAERESNWSVLVRDEGPGIDGVSAQRLFEPFYRDPKMQAAGIKGYGIGLALIAHIVRVHGGGVDFVPSPRGAVLRIELAKLSSSAASAA